MTSMVIWARLRGAAVRVRLRRPAGPGPDHPESMTAELDDAAEALLAWLDVVLWPGQAAPGRLGADYTCRHPKEEDQA
ncbi:MAG: hypothetical protein J2P30_20570 [Actinobacteria bacterium]|nr:hypothetical protein [Actinomycetota bacterium]